MKKSRIQDVIYRWLKREGKIKARYLKIQDRALWLVSPAKKKETPRFQVFIFSLNNNNRRLYILSVSRGGGVSSLVEELLEERRSLWWRRGIRGCSLETVDIAAIRLHSQCNILQSSKGTPGNKFRVCFDLSRNWASRNPSFSFPFSPEISPFTTTPLPFPGIKLIEEIAPTCGPRFAFRLTDYDRNWAPGLSLDFNQTSFTLGLIRIWSRLAPFLH